MSSSNNEETEIDVIDRYMDILYSDGTDEEIQQKLEELRRSLTPEQNEILNSLRLLQ